jgi:hypothetical protein
MAPRWQAPWWPNYAGTFISDARKNRPRPIGCGYNQWPMPGYPIAVVSVINI